ncbi:MAG: MFS transporter [Methylobacter sp.]|nr:MFS transporter [Methylobacter sp.]
MASAEVRSVPGIILLSLEREFHWSRETISGAVSVNLLLFGLAGPFLGRLMDLYGAKTITLLMIFLIVLGAARTLFMREAWQMYMLWGVIVGIGSGGTSMVMGSTIVNRWFHERRGLALGVLGAAMSSGQLLFIPIIMNLNTHFGWGAAILFSVLLFGFIVLPLVIRFMVNNPELKGMKPYGMKQMITPPIRPDARPMRLAMRNPQFWLLAFSFGICGFTTSGLFQTHLIPHGIEHGFSEMTMAASLGLMGATDITGTVLSGWPCDRFGKRGPLAVYYLLRGLSLMLLPYVKSTPQLMAFSVVYGLNWLSTVPATSALTADLFGKQNVGVVFGRIFFAHQLGAALASYGAGYLHSLAGDYTLAFMASGFFALIAAGLVTGIRNRPQPISL